MELKIREMRKSLHLSQTDFAELVGVSLRTVGAWERGETLPDAEQIWNCAVALNCTPNDVLGWEETKDIYDSNEAALLVNYRNLTPDRKRALLTTAADGAASSRETPEIPKIQANK